MKNNLSCEATPELVQKHTEILALIPYMYDDIKLMRKKLIDGNGQKSLITKHDLLTCKVENHLDNHSKNNETSKWLIGLSIAVFICIVTTITSLYISYQNPNKKVNNETIYTDNFINDNRLQKYPEMADR